MKATFNLHNLIQCKKDKLLSIDFDLSPSEEAFAAHLTTVCEHFRDHAGMKEGFNMPQIFHSLKHRELTIHFKKVSERLDELISYLLQMNLGGPNTFSYVVSRNYSLMKNIEALFRANRIAQWVGDENMTRHNQLDFVYKCINQIFDSPLRSLLCSEESTEKMVTEVVP